MKPNYAIALFLLALPTQWMVADDELLKKMTPFMDGALGSAQSGHRGRQGWSSGIVARIRSSTNWLGQAG
ncbi:MAG: hypothetical protein ABGX07_16795 [Pirellulaceae bacterium]